MSTAHPSFELLDESYIDALNLTVQHFRHKKTGAAHYHLASDSDENVFLVALRTVPEDSTGVAHILEHTALCGSKRFPVRDPFFMMLRRSLNTFMNAFTSSDWTAYPFATRNRKDFSNLLDVYLDAVFFSRLDPLDFAQEGHRLEFAKPADTSSELEFKGVVFNEMKGAMSSIHSVLWDKLCYHLFPTTTYHYNSGGDPEHIPELSYEGLKDFYQSHYHPSNAIFMTFGNIPAQDHQAVFQEKALSAFSALDKQIRVPAEQALASPLQVSERYAWDDSADCDAKTHIVMGWLLGESADLESVLQAQLLSNVLLDNSASPLMHKLETSEYGQSPSPMCGLEDSLHELVFCCGLEGSRDEHRDAVEGEILGVIEDVAENGVPQQQLEAMLHQLELSQREVSGDGMPYGLQLILTALGPAIHYRDPINMLDLEPALEKLRQQIKDPDFIKQIAKRLLLNNKHRITLVLSPDRELSGERVAREQEKLKAIKESLDDAQKQAIVDQAAALQARQEQVDDISILPKVGIDDIPRDIPRFSPSIHGEVPHQHTAYAQGTNGLSYQQVIAPLPALSMAQTDLLPLYNAVLTEVGVGKDDYLQTQQRHAREVGSISSMSSMRANIDDAQTLQGYLITSSKALARNARAQAQLMRDTCEQARFDELPRLKDLVSQIRARKEQALVSNGHILAMTAASAGMSPLAAINHRLGGLASVQTIRTLDQALNNDASLADFAQSLHDLHHYLQNTPRQWLTITSPDMLEDLIREVDGVWQGAQGSDVHTNFAPEKISAQIQQLWLTNTQVNFCARAYPTVSGEHPDAAALSVLGGVLRNGFLHRAIREQGGAYGGGASQDTSIAAFKFFSYRDPRLTDTLSDFDKAIAWVLEEVPGAQAIEEAVLGVISAMDKPGSPAGEAKQDFYNRLFGRSYEHRLRYRERVLAVTGADLQRVASTYLRPENASTAIITNSATYQENKTLLEALDCIEL